MTTSIILIFILGYLSIVLEHPLRLDKSVPALIMGALCWIVIAIAKPDLINSAHQLASQEEIIFHMTAKIAEILFFLLGAMTIVELIDLHLGFSVLTALIQTKSKTKLLWIISVIAFFLAAILDILASTIVVVKLLQNLISDEKERRHYIGISVIITNIGGVWSPIGCVTSTMLWIGKLVSADKLILSLLLPSLVSAIVVLVLLSFTKHFRGYLTISDDKPIETTNTSVFFLLFGLLALLLIPVWNVFFSVPPYIGMVFSLGLIWLLSEIIHPNEDFEHLKKNNPNHFKVTNALSRIEMSSILFFLGILLAVGALESLGILNNLAHLADNYFGDRNVIAILIGLASSVIDNVPIVAAAMGMYQDPTDSMIWHFIALTAGIGGSILIIGSASGVAAMGLTPKLSFAWYLKNISVWAIIAYTISILCFLII
jgi:Na+/H+ antiporter NhaD/arsenite permease-like protein